MRTIVVLMWKHMLVRKRKIFSTLLEFVVPVLLFMFLYLLEGPLLEEEGEPPAEGGKSTTTTTTTTTTPKPPGLRLSFSRLGTSISPVGSLIGDAVVLYYPATPVANAFMNIVAEKLSIRPLRQFPTKNNLLFSNGYFPISNKTQWLKFRTIMRPWDAVIIFHNFYGATWPSTMNYTIRMTEGLHLKPFRLTEITRSHGKGSPGIQQLIFMSLQWAIDNAYISLRSGIGLNQILSIQEFPYLRQQSFGKFEIYIQTLYMFTYLSLLYTFALLVSRLTTEKSSGVPELIKMEGVSTNTLALSHILNVLPAGVVYAIVGCVTIKKGTVFPRTSAFFFITTLLLYYNTIIAFAFTISHVLKGPEYATTFAVVVYFLLCILSEAITSKSIPNAVKYLVGLLPHAPLSYAYSELSLNEIHGTGTGFDNMGTVKDGEFHLSILSSFIMHIVQIVLFLCLAKYLSLINPGKYGQAMPWHCNLKKAKKDEHVRDDASQQDERYFEEPPANLKVGIFVDNVSKKYPKHTALKNVTLKIFEGEITVLLGHNGAGKTTLMSIITGMTNPTKGKVYIYGIDSTKQKQARKHIGLCPQHNMYFPDLNLHEHLMFFTLLKGEKYKVARESSRQLAGKLGLEPKLKDMWVRLSGGMQRRAQLACALAGDAAVLILDEPTAGLDIETRRGLWDLLLSLRGARTVLLSTHHMEEADALGDRVAALRDGELGCYATNMFLKRAIGDGYRLTLNTVHEPKEHAITQKVHETVPEATVRERTISSITYNLPLNSSKTFPKLFGVIEENKAGLEIISIGVGVATLEEVFLKLGSNVDAIQGVDEEPEYGASGQGIESGAEYDQEKFYMDLEGKSHKKLKGARLYRNQFSVLLKRQLRFVLYRKWIFIFLQIFLPYFLIYNVTRGSNNEYQEADNRSLPLDLDMYTDIPSKRILCNFQLNESNTPFPFLRTLDSIYPDVEFQATNDVSNTIARIGKKSIKDYSTYLSGIEMNDTVAKVLYSRTVPHIAPVTLNIMSNLLGMRYLNQSKCHILTRNYPIQRSDKKPKSTAVIWTTWLTFVFEISLTYGLALPAREYVTGARNVHIMSGCSIQLYWFTTLLFHTVFAFVLLIIPIMLAAFLIDKDSTIDQVAIMVVLLVGTVALLAFMFWVTMVSKGRSPVLILVACIFILTLIFPLVKMVNDAIDVMVEGSEQKGQIYYAHKVLYFLATPYTVSVGMKDVAKTAMKNAQAGQYSISNYFSTHPESNCYTLIILLVQAIFFIELVLLIQKGTINTWCDRLKNKKYKPGDIDEINHEVNKEKAYVAHEITKKPADITTDSMLIHEVHKHYRSCYRKPINAVRGISISVKKGECFGLLGVNGAGKSSTFKMLTAEECATRGKIYGNGYFLNSSSSTKYLQTLSYTPQYNGLDLFLTGEQNLRLLLTLRGLEKETVKQEVKNWLKFVDLEVYAKKRLEAYSGGCMRRLVAAGSLCSGASVTLLDEPSAGVDVGARRQLWTALHVALRYQRSIIITSHSLDEMEVLCDRIAILCAGRVRALGSPNGLRTEYAAGHAVRFKIKHRITADNANEADDLNSQIMKTFDCELKDSHMTMLLYHINVTMHYSDLFQALEGLKNQFSDLIEDYTVTDTTLEEVFLALAEENKVPQPRV